MRHVFTYGSLMFAEVWEYIVRGRYRSAEAVLCGYRRYSVHEQAFPVIKPGEPGDRLPGLLYRNVSMEDIQRLDQFEGDYYFRTPLPVRQQERVETAEVYVLRPRFYGIARTEDWDPDDFERNGLLRFRSEYRGFR